MKEAATWTDANKACQEIAPRKSFPNLPITRRHLASVVDKEENDFIVRLIGRDNAWLGGTKLADGTWTWTDGLEWGFTNWRAKYREPNNSGGIENSVLAGVGEGKEWNDAPFQIKYFYVCQYLDLNQF